MKPTLQLLIAFVALSFNSWAQQSVNPVHELKLENREAFIKNAKPLIEKMGEKRIVSLGEGTHGTSEFYKVRYWITRELIEKKGFTHIGFENDLRDRKSVV